MPLLLLTDPVTLIYDTATGEVFYMKSQKLWYASSVSDTYKDKFLALFKKDEKGVDIAIEDLLLETGLIPCPPEKALTLLKHVAIELVAALAKEEQHHLQHAKLVSLMHRKLDERREIQENMLTKFNILLNEKKREIATLRQEQSMKVQLKRGGEEVEVRPKKTKKLAPKTSPWDEFMKTQKEAAISKKKQPAPPASESDDDDISDVSSSSSDLLGAASIKGKSGAAVKAKKAEFWSSSESDDDDISSSSSELLGAAGIKGKSGAAVKANKRQPAPPASEGDDDNISSSSSELLGAAGIKGKSGGAKKAEFWSSSESDDDDIGAAPKPTKRWSTSRDKMTPIKTLASKRKQKKTYVPKKVDANLGKPSAWDEYVKRQTAWDEFVEKRKAAAPNAQNAEPYSSDELSLHSTSSIDLLEGRDYDLK